MTQVNNELPIVYWKNVQGNKWIIKKSALRNPKIHPSRTPK